MFRNSRQTWRWIVIAEVIGLFCFSAAWGKLPADSSGTSYAIVKLDDADGAWRCYPSDVNNLGDVVGFVEDAAMSERRAAYWQVSRSGVAIHSEISTLTGGSWAFGINNAGEIVGCGNDPAGREMGLYWAGPESLPMLLPSLTDTGHTIATSVNDNGVICGVSDGQAVAWRVNWSGGELSVWGPVALPTLDEKGGAFAIGNNDEHGFARIAGVFRMANNQSTAAVSWAVQSLPDETLAVDPLPQVVEAGEVHVFGVNDRGAICGDAGWPTEAVVWIGDESQTLHRDKKITSASAQDISNNGTIVGSGDRSQYGPEAVVWPSAAEKMILLNNYIGRKSPFLKLLEACAVNEMGEIVGGGLTGPYPGTGRAAFLAIPE